MPAKKGGSQWVPNVKDVKDGTGRAHRKGWGPGQVTPLVQGVPIIIRSPSGPRTSDLDLDQALEFRPTVGAGTGSDPTPKKRA